MILKDFYTETVTGHDDVTTYLFESMMFDTSAEALSYQGSITNFSGYVIRDTKRNYLAVVGTNFDKFPTIHGHHLTKFIVYRHLGYDG